MKLIHLNVESFKYFDALVDFLMIEKPDIISLVEASDGDIFGTGEQRDYIAELEKKFGWGSVFYPTVFRDFGDYKIGWGAAVLSRFPIAVESKMFFGNQEPSILGSDYPLFTDRPKYERYPYAWKINLPFLATHIETEKGIFRLLTTHFHVSYACFETLQIWQDAERAVEYLDGSDLNIPTIFTGDLNIRNESMAIKTLAEKMIQQSADIVNTLTPTIHPLFKNEPGHLGLGIDHIFTRDIFVNSCEVVDVKVSDHLPLILNFEL